MAAPRTEEEYLKEFGYAPGSAVGNLGWRLFSAPTDADRLALRHLIGFTVPTTKDEGLALAGFERGLARLAKKLGAK